MLPAHVTETRIASVYLDDKGIVIITMKDCGVIDEYDIMDLNLVIRHTCNKFPRLKLLIALGEWKMTRKAKEMALKEDALSQTKARAIVVSNNIKASTLNFLKLFSNRSYPQQFFCHKEEAYSWLLNLKAQD